MPFRSPWRENPTGRALALDSGGYRIGAAVFGLEGLERFNNLGHGWSQGFLLARTLQQQIHHLHGSSDGAKLPHAWVDDLRQSRLVLEILAPPLQEVVVVAEVGRISAVLACEKLQQEDAEAPYVVLRMRLA